MVNVMNWYISQLAMMDKDEYACMVPRNRQLECNLYFVVSNISN